MVPVRSPDMPGIKPYQSFTTASLLLPESLQVVKLLEYTRDWNVVRTNAVADNVVQARTQETSRRIVGEVISRLKLLSAAELELLIDGSAQEQAHLLWLGVCRRYTLIRDFVLEVVRERYQTFQQHLPPEEFTIFFNRKADWHPELDRMSADTRRRLAPMLFAMMRQAGLLLEGEILAPVFPSARFVDAVRAENPDDLALLPTFEVRGFGTC